MVHSVPTFFILEVMTRHKRSGSSLRRRTCQTPGQRVVAGHAVTMVTSRHEVMTRHEGNHCALKQGQRIKKNYFHDLSFQKSPDKVVRILSLSPHDSCLC